MSNKIPSQTILPITYPIRPINLSSVSDNQNETMNKILKTVETHVVSTVKSIFSAIYSYAGKHRRNNESESNDVKTVVVPELWDIMIDPNDDVKVASMV